MDKYIEIIESYNNYLRKIPQGLNYIIDNFKKGNNKIALNAIIDFSEGLVWMNDVVGILREENIEIDYDIKKIEIFLEEINNGLTKEDFLLVSDIIEYELIEFFENVSPINYRS